MLIRLGGFPVRKCFGAGKVGNEPTIKRHSERAEEHIVPMQAQKNRRLSTALRVEPTRTYKRGEYSQTEGLPNGSNGPSSSTSRYGFPGTSLGRAV